MRAADPLDRVDPGRVPAHADRPVHASPPIAGSLVWNFALIGGGALLGDRWEELGDYVAVFQWVVIVLIVGAIGWFVWTRLVRPKLTGRGTRPDGSDDVVDASLRDDAVADEPGH